MITNYARNLKTHEYVFLRGDTPEELPYGEPGEWCFWVPPRKIALRSCRIIGECASDYCERLGHVPSICAKCLRN